MQQPEPDTPAIEPGESGDSAMTVLPAESPAFEEFGSDNGPGTGGTGPAGGGAALAAVHDIPVKVQAVLGRARMPVGDLLQLQRGTVVELDRRVGEPVEVFVNDRLIARGEVVMIDHALGVTLTEIIRPDR